MSDSIAIGMTPDLDEEETYIDWAEVEFEMDIISLKLAYKRVADKIGIDGADIYIGAVREKLRGITKEPSLEEGEQIFKGDR